MTTFSAKNMNPSQSIAPPPAMISRGPPSQPAAIATNLRFASTNWASARRSEKSARPVMMLRPDDADAPYRRLTRGPAAIAALKAWIDKYDLQCMRCAE